LIGTTLVALTMQGSFGSKGGNMRAASRTGVFQGWDSNRTAIGRPKGRSPVTAAFVPVERAPRVVIPVGDDRSRRLEHSHAAADEHSHSLVENFFAEGERKEQGAWTYEDLDDDLLARDPEAEFESFDHVPRRRWPLAVLVTGFLVLGVAGVRWVGKSTMVSQPPLIAPPPPAAITAIPTPLPSPTSEPPAEPLPRPPSAAAALPPPPDVSGLAQPSPPVSTSRGSSTEESPPAATPLRGYAWSPREGRLVRVDETAATPLDRTETPVESTQTPNPP
jgi:hypothetical protein